MAGSRGQPVSLSDIFGDDDDDDYEPSTEQSDITREGSDDNESQEGEFTDAQESLVEIEFDVGGESQDNDEDEGEQTETEATTTRPTARITIQQINQLLGSHGPLRELLVNHYRIMNPGAGLGGGGDDEDEDEEESDNSQGFFLYGQRRRRRMRPRADRFPKVPSEAGRALMNSGTYGQNDHFMDIRRKRKTSVGERLMWRRLGVDVRGSARRQTRLLAQDLIPSTSTADKIIHYDARAYCGQFSDDGNFFFSCTQNFKVRMYDTSNPYEWKYYKTVDYPFGSWTITDATLSPDNKYLAYSSIRHVVCLAPTDPYDESDHTYLDFNNMPGETFGSHPRGFGIWSLRFSGDGREIVAGTSEHSVIVYDLERRQAILKLRKHREDVNAVCFGDRSSPHILYSGSDDQTLRVWDRRSMADGREAGVFVGHTEGLTYVDSKGDGRYVLSNGKDQMMKLWDLRKMVSPHHFDQMDIARYSQHFDYRFDAFDFDDYVPNPDDCSVVTFRGHSVLRTLIRCHFSPPNSSNSRYVYSGSEDGKVWIWNLDSTVKAKIDVSKATLNTRPRTGREGEHFGYEMHGRSRHEWKTCVRDASWSPSAPVLAATSWNGFDMLTGTVSMHSWNDGGDDDEAEPLMGLNYGSRLEPREDFDRSARQQGNGRWISRSREEGRGLRSTVVPPRRFGDGAAAAAAAEDGDTRRDTSW